MSLSSALFLSENKFHHIINLVGKEESDCDKFLHIMKKIIGWSEVVCCSERKYGRIRYLRAERCPMTFDQINIVENLENYYPTLTHEYDFIKEDVNTRNVVFPILRGICRFQYRRTYTFDIIKLPLTMTIVINTKVYEKTFDPGCFKNIHINTINTIMMKEFQPNVSRVHDYLRRVYIPLIEA
jgi:hypothetical protein